MVLKSERWRTKMNINEGKKPEIIIDEEFMRLLPPLDEFDYCSLEDNILIYGCMNPLVLWNYTTPSPLFRKEIVEKVVTKGYNITMNMTTMWRYICILLLNRQVNSEKTITV